VKFNESGFFFDIGTVIAKLLAANPIAVDVTAGVKLTCDDLKRLGTLAK
jgi:hypothetical protein